MDLIYDLLYPRTDAGVAVQVGLLLAIVAVGLYRTWDKPDLRRLIFGAGFFLLGLMVLRAAH